MIGDAKYIIEWLTALGPWAVAGILALAYLDQRHERLDTQRWLRDYLDNKLIPALDAIARGDRALRLALFKRNMIPSDRVLGDDGEGG